MQTQYQHNIYTNLSQNFVDTFIKYYLLSIIYTLYAAGAPSPANLVFHKTEEKWPGHFCYIVNVMPLSSEEEVHLINDHRVV